MNTCSAPHLKISPKRITMANTALSSLRLCSSHMRLWMNDHSFTQHVLNIHQSGYSAVWLLHGWCHMELLPSWYKFCIHHTTMHQFRVFLFKAAFVWCMCVYMTLHYSPDKKTAHLLAAHRRSTLHYNNYVTLQYNADKKTAHCQQPKEDQHYITLHYITLQYSPDTKTAHLLAAHRSTLHYTTLHYTTLQSRYENNPPAGSPQKINITLHHITLHYITYYITVQTRKQPTCWQPIEDQHYITLHYITVQTRQQSSCQQSIEDQHYTTLQSRQKNSPPASSP